MSDIVDYFAHLPIAVRAAILGGGLLFFWILEGWIPLYRFSFSRWKHAKVNLSLTLMNIILGGALAGVLLWITHWASEDHVGFLHLVQWPIWLEVLIGVLFLDFFAAFLIHWLEHHIGWMWRIHLIHHTDREVDVTTGIRHHPAEAVLRLSFLVVGVLLIGANMGIIVIYQSLSLLFGHWIHSNTRFPIWLDRVLSLVFVTPTFHKVHHHYVQPQTDSNYGNIFSLWDRLFHTTSHIAHNELVYGIDSHLEEGVHRSVWQLLKLPFTTKG
ncbi:MAG: sterol desaturase family protein [Zavarzinella sp.]